MKLALITLLVASSGAFAQRSGGAGHARGGGNFGRFAPPPVISHPAHVGTVIVPYPVFYGGYYYYDPSVAAQQPAPAGYYNDDSAAYGAPAQSPVAIINQSYQPDNVNPVIRDYSNTPLPQTAANPDGRPDDQPTIYLIALTDHTIVAAIAYWAESGDTLAYITADGNQNRVSLALVDREFSQKLNADRHVDFHLPPARHD